MKKLISIILCIIFMISIVSCVDEEREIIIDTNTGRKIKPRKVELIAQEEKERYGKLAFEMRWGYENKLSAAYNKAYLIARVKLKTIVEKIQKRPRRYSRQRLLRRIKVRVKTKSHCRNMEHQISLSIIVRLLLLETRS